MTERIRIAVIYGSTREGRFCDRVATWVLGRLAEDRRFVAERVDPADAHSGPEALSGLRRRLAEADAFIVVTPEYNHSYPAPLKAFIDSIDREWRSKPVAFVSYGGVSGGLRAVEHLRLVFAELHAATLRDTVSFANPWQRFLPDGTLVEARASEQAMAQLLAHLDWWARALKKARLALPYDHIAA
jgi:NAD(P)H-dependent FMN reductase